MVFDDEWVSLRDAIGPIVSSVRVRPNPQVMAMIREGGVSHVIDTMRFRTGANSIVQQAGKHIGG